MDNNSIITGKTRDIGGLNVVRVLPFAQQRQIGPFVFLDHMGPITVDPQHKMDVRPHPHIGLATVTYLFAGQGYHRDSIGSRQIIKPGDLNWMTAGRGIVHSERTPPEEVNSRQPQSMHGVQIWVSLPVDQEECDPTFVHWPCETMPDFNITEGFSAKLMIGEFQDKRSPVHALSRSLFMDFQFTRNVSQKLSFNEKEIGIFFVEGQGLINGKPVKKEELIYISQPQEVLIEATAGSRCVVVGGTPHPEPRYMWWNFVSSRKERLRQAAEDWENQRMGKVVDETEITPLPDIPLPV